MSRDGAPGRARPGRARPGGAERRLLVEILPPEGVPIRFEVAGLGARTVAQIADILVTFAVLVVLMAVLFLSDLVSLEAVIAIGALLFFAIRVPYYVLTETLMNGQTWGKRLTGLRVIAADGRSLTAHAVTVRNLLKEMEIFIPGTLLLATTSLDRLTVILLLGWIGILLAVPLTNAHRQRLGDILAGTYVVMLPTPVLLPDLAEQPVADAAYRFLPHHLDHYGRYELQTLEALLQVDAGALSRIAAERHRANLRKVAETISRRIGYETHVPEADTEGFLLAFYRTQRAYLENRKLFGDAREDKFHRDTDGSGGARG
ncbi:RDD family protein [Rhodobacteraceae bacterium 2CG4]|uniref:RDD family protein n=1 Tax=Halovulum marinum TaxID=2662447 RepID=A0A6L5YW73_9RHOB|nr:RDD family protein [Halovulum marinum]MSU88112.1 RDD family protein [Halovulum marinum]